MVLQWHTAEGFISHPEAVSNMEAHVAAIVAGEADERVWLVEHPPLYTAGTSAKAGDLLAPNLFPVYSSGRGGQYTYHGPGQRVVYLMLDLKRRNAPKPPDLRAYVKSLENWIIATLAEFGVEGFIREGRVGVWVSEAGSESKIAALGIRVRRGVAYHGIAINVNPNLSHYAGIVPCGIQGYGVTSLQKLGVDASMGEVDKALKRNFEQAFGTI